VRAFSVRKQELLAKPGYVRYTLEIVDVVKPVKSWIPFIDRPTVNTYRCLSTDESICEFQTIMARMKLPITFDPMSIKSAITTWIANVYGDNGVNLPVQSGLMRANAVPVVRMLVSSACAKVMGNLAHLNASPPAK